MLADAVSVLLEYRIDRVEDRPLLALRRTELSSAVNPGTSMPRGAPRTSVRSYGFDLIISDFIKVSVLARTLGGFLR